MTLIAPVNFAKARPGIAAHLELAVSFVTARDEWEPTKGRGYEQMALAFVRLVGRIRSSKKIDIREALLIFTIVSVHDSMIIGINSTRIKGEYELGTKNLEIGGKTAFCYKSESYFSTRRLFIYVSILRFTVNRIFETAKYDLKRPCVLIFMFGFLFNLIVAKY